MGAARQADAQEWSRLRSAAKRLQTWWTPHSSTRKASSWTIKCPSSKNLTTQETCYPHKDLLKSYLMRSQSLHQGMDLQLWLESKAEWALDLPSLWTKCQSCRLTATEHMWSGSARFKMFGTRSIHAKSMKKCWDLSMPFAMVSNSWSSSGIRN